MTHYIGLDAHSKICTAVVLDATGKLTASKQFPTSEGNLLAFIKATPKPRQLAFEEQNLAHWLFLTVSGKVDKLVVAHPCETSLQREASTSCSKRRRIRISDPPLIPPYSVRHEAHISEWLKATGKAATHRIP